MSKLSFSNSFWLASDHLRFLAVGKLLKINKKNIHSSGLKTNGSLLCRHAVPTPPSRIRANTEFLKLHLQQGISLLICFYWVFFPVLTLRSNSVIATKAQRRELSGHLIVE